MSQWSGKHLKLTSALENAHLAESTTNKPYKLPQLPLIRIGAYLAVYSEHSFGNDWCGFKQWPLIPGSKHDGSIITDHGIFGILLKHQISLM